MAEKKNKLSAEARLSLLLDDGTYTELDKNDASGARIGYGSVCGATVYAYAEGESEGFGAASAKKLEKVYALAEKTGSPVVSVYDSQGVQLEGGLATLDTCSSLLGHISRLSGVVPQIAVVAGTCGGFEALCANMADLCLMEKNAELFLTAPFVDSEAKKDASGSDAAKKAGVAAVVCEGEEALFGKVRQLLAILPLNNLASAPVVDFEAPAADTDGCPVCVTVDTDSKIQLFAGLGSSAKTLLATLAGSVVGVVKVDGRLCRGDSVKIARLVQLCDAYSVPVVTFVDSEGFLQSTENDLKGGIRNASLLANVLSEATTPKVCVITGKAIGSVYSVLCGKNAGNDMVYAWDKAVISAVPAKTAVGIFWENRIEKDSDIENLAAEYEKTEANAVKAVEAGLVDRVITREETRGVLVETLDMLASKRVTTLSKKHGILPY